jgi:hypothetical protein
VETDQNGQKFKLRRLRGQDVQARRRVPILVPFGLARRRVGRVGRQRWDLHMTHDHLSRRGAAPALHIDRAAHRVQPLELLGNSRAPQPHSHHPKVVIRDRSMPVVRDASDDRDRKGTPQQAESIQQLLHAPPLEIASNDPRARSAAEVLHPWIVVTSVRKPGCVVQEVLQALRVARVDGDLRVIPGGVPQQLVSR